MKRHKRDNTNKIYIHGFDVGRKGKTCEVCPYTSNVHSRAAWLAGWREGRTQYFHGYITDK